MPRAASAEDSTVVLEVLLGKSIIVVGFGCRSPKIIIEIIGISLQIVAIVCIRPLALLPNKFKPVTVVAAHAPMKIEYFFLFEIDLGIVLQK